MKKHDDGGPAFPLWHHGMNDGRQWPCSGMSLFDYYVGVLMAGSMANQEYLSAARKVGKQDGLLVQHTLTVAAGEYADAMIAEKRRREAEKETDDA